MLHKYINLQLKENEKEEILNQKIKYFNTLLEETNKEILLCKNDLNYVQTIDFDKEMKNIELRKKLGTQISESLHESIETKAEKLIVNCLGFDIYALPFQFKEKYYVKLKRENTYQFEISDSIKGSVVTIINHIKNISERYNELIKNKKTYEAYISEGNENLKKKENYVDIINKLKIEIAQLDIELGVKDDSDNR